MSAKSILDRWRVALLLIALLTVFPSLAFSGDAPRVVGSYPMWLTKTYPMSGIPVARLTHLNLAYAQINAKGKPVFDVGRDPRVQNSMIGVQLSQLREINPDVKFLVSIGGWDWSDRFSEIAATEDSRQVFVDGCVELIEAIGVDGIDIAWQFPVAGGKHAGAPEDRPNLTLLLNSLQRSLNEFPDEADVDQYIITCSISAAPEHLDHIELSQIHRSCDWINLMAYDLWGSWSERTGHHAPLEAPVFASGRESERSVVGAVNRLHLAGVPKDKVVVGLPCYGRGVVGAFNENYGVAQHHRGPARGTWNDEMFAYNDLVQNYFARTPSHWDQNARSGWMYDRQTGTFISFEDQRSATLKAHYVLAEGLGGLMLWDLTMDTIDHTSLLSTVQEILLGTSAPVTAISD